MYPFSVCNCPAALKGGANAFWRLLPEEEKRLFHNFRKSFSKHNTQSSQVPMPTCQPGNQNRLQSLTKKHEPGSKVANSQDTAAKEEEEKGENSKANTK